MHQDKTFTTEGVGFALTPVVKGELSETLARRSGAHAKAPAV